ncbi:hypothetical protein B0A50_05717 [Salinomyces thailandicus]|uniref:F-box domain-containing protein n=1 Tax=Salinomyces thailandicus TaxID=706561 RepID=A0A4V5N3R6_9PEZI|nr:hypothetical protein B0A50_05717 [Salinomyces thailandica]
MASCSPHTSASPSLIGLPTNSPASTAPSLPRLPLNLSASTSSPLLELPSELLGQIIGHVLRQDKTISVVQPDGARLCLPNAVLIASKELYHTGIGMFWSMNTFTFGTGHVLQSFLGNVRPKMLQSIRSIVLSEEVVCDFYTFTVLGFHRFNRSSMLWLIPNWPPSLGCLARLPKLQRLEVVVERLKDPGACDIDRALLDAVHGLNKDGVFDVPKVILYGWPQGCSAAHYTRDLVFRSIPATVLNGLRSLQMTYRRHPYVRDEKLSTAEALQYAKDLRSEKWKYCPYEVRDANGYWTHRNEADRWKALLWLEARTAVYWDGDAPSSSSEVGVEDIRLFQWCTWTTEWWVLKDYGPRQETPGPRQETPRKWEELFDEQGELRPGFRLEDVEIS